MAAKRTGLTTEGAIAENAMLEDQEGMMQWIAFEDRLNQGDWRAEANDYENEGVVYVTIFSGPESKERAEEYAAIKNAQEARLARVAS